MTEIVAIKKDVFRARDLVVNRVDKQKSAIDSIGRTPEEAVKNLKNFTKICSYGHDQSMAFQGIIDDLGELTSILKQGAASRQFADEYTLDWLKRTGQLEKRSSV